MTDKRITAPYAAKASARKALDFIHTVYVAHGTRITTGSMASATVPERDKYKAWYLLRALDLVTKTGDFTARLTQLESVATQEQPHLFDKVLQSTIYQPLYQRVDLPEHVPNEELKIAFAELYANTSTLNEAVYLFRYLSGIAAGAEPLFTQDGLIARPTRPLPLRKLVGTADSPSLGYLKTIKVPLPPKPPPGIKYESLHGFDTHIHRMYRFTSEEEKTTDIEREEWEMNTAEWIRMLAHLWLKEDER